MDSRMALSASILVVALAGCGPAGNLCSVVDHGDGTATITCPDGSSTSVSNGADGRACSVSDDGDGTKTISCSDGTEAMITDGPAGPEGYDGRSCTVSEQEAGRVTLTCDDGTVVTFSGWPAGVVEGDYRIEDEVDALLAARVTEITGSLIVTTGGLPALPTLTVHSIGADLRIEDNDALTGLEALASLERLGGGLTIVDNPALPQCEAEALRDRLQALGWAGPAVIEGNDLSTPCP